MSATDPTSDTYLDDRAEALLAGKATRGHLAKMVAETEVLAATLTRRIDEVAARPVEPPSEADRLRALTDQIIARWAQPPPESIAQLPKPTKRNAEKGRCDHCGGWHGLPAIHLDYMGHADVTLALLEIDPGWSIDPVTDDRGVPLIDNQNGRLVMWAHLTVNGVTRWCVGTCEASKSDPEKELIGDALRNGAMRFGVGTRLWSKADGADPAGSGRGGGYGNGGRHPEPADDPADPDRVRAVETFERLKRLAGTPVAEHMRSWATRRERSLSVPEMAADRAWCELVDSEIADASRQLLDPAPDAEADAEAEAERRAELARAKLDEAGLDPATVPIPEPDTTEGDTPT